MRANPQLGGHCLYHFAPEEFRRGEDWWSMMNPRLLVLLDRFRDRWGAVVRISPHERAIGRRMGVAPTQHNVDRWGEVRAVDAMPVGMDSADDRRHALAIAREIGFTGIGIYPDWNPIAGVHLDVRRDRVPGNPATWGGIAVKDGQDYVAIEEVL